MRNSEHNKIRKGFRIISKVTSVFDAVNFTFSSSNYSVCFSDSKKKVPKIILFRSYDVGSFRTLQVSQVQVVFV